MVLQHQRRLELCEQTYDSRPARVERRCGLFVVLHATIQGDSPSKRPPRGRNPISPLGRVTLADGRPCAVHRTPSVIWVSSPCQSHTCHENGAPIFEKRKEHKEERKKRKRKRKEKKRKEKRREEKRREEKKKKI